MNNAEWVNKDFYKVLGVSKGADQATIKRAYRKLAKENHPDSKPGDTAAEARFKDVAEAYDVVGDPEKRKQYDEMRSAFAGGGLGGFPGGFGGGQRTTTGTAGFDLGDLFGDLFRGGTTTTGGGFGGAGGRRTRPMRGEDIETEVTVDFKDAVEGSTVTMRLQSDAACTTCQGTGGKPGTHPHICPTCEGAGMVVGSVGGAFSMNETCPECHGRQLVYDESCPVCHGSGRGQTSRTVTARIPAGVADGKQIRLRGKGGAGEHGGPAGDLLVRVRVRPHARFGRKGDNLTVEVPIRFDEAVLGGQITVPTLSGAPVTLKVQPGTPNGRVMRVRGRGVRRKDGSTGDLLVTVEVDVPDSLEGPALEAVQAYRDAMGDQTPRARLGEGV